MLHLKDYNSEVKSWRMYFSDNPSQFVITDSLVLKKRTEKQAFIFIYSLPVWIFSVWQTKGNIIPLEPDIRKIHNKDTLYLVGCYNDHNHRVVQGIVETPLNEKYADTEIRVKTENINLLKEIIKENETVYGNIGQVHIPVMLTPCPGDTDPSQN